MQPRKPGDASDDSDIEQREYSSPACSLHEVEQAQAVVIYHNPKCSKSRETLALIQASGVTPRVIEYLKTPPTEAELLAIVVKLGVSPLELVRTNEAVFKEKYAGKHLNDAQLLQAIIADPILLQRPIVVRGDNAVIGRPPENVGRLLT